MIDMKNYLELTPNQKVEKLKELSKSDKIKELLKLVFDNDFKVNICIPKNRFNNCIDFFKKIKNDNTIINPFKLKEMIMEFKDLNRKDQETFLSNLKEMYELTFNDIILFLMIIRKDLFVGLKQVHTFLDVPYYSFMLAEKYSDKNLQKKIKNNSGVTKLLIEPKLDGIRMIYIPSKKIFVTRNQNTIDPKIYSNLMHISKQLDILNQSAKNDLIFDGEFFLENWNITSSLVNSFDLIPDKKLNYNIFAVLNEKEYLDNLKENSSIKILKYNDLKKIKKDKKLVNIKFIEAKDSIDILGLDFDEIKHKLFEYTTKYLSLGFEGIMVKQDDYLYDKKRSFRWMKMKDIKELETIITDVIEGQGKNNKTLGALNVKTKINNKLIEFKVGSGFDDKTRNELFEKYLNNDLIGKICEITYQELSNNSIPRFPVFRRLRTDKLDLNVELDT